MLRKQLNISIRFTLITAVLLGICYPLLAGVVAHWIFPRQANGELIYQNGHVIGSRLIGQTFTGEKYFHGRPSAAGSGYDATASGGTNFGPTNAQLLARINKDVARYQAGNHDQPVPIDLVTASGSGLDSDISPASAYYQVDRIAAARGIGTATLKSLVTSHIQGRQFGILGEPRINVLELNLALDRLQK